MIFYIPHSCYISNVLICMQERLITDKSNTVGKAAMFKNRLYFRERVLACVYRGTIPEIIHAVQYTNNRDTDKVQNKQKKVQPCKHLDGLIIIKL